MMTKMRLTMIRHAESISNFGGRSSEPESIPLTEKGWQQAKAVATCVSDPPDLLVVSRMLRARQSAEPIIQKFPDVPVKTWSIHEFVFLNFQYEAPRTREERKPAVDAYWQKCDPKAMNPHSESFETFWSRVMAFHARVCGYPANSIFAVSHGFFMRAFSWGVSEGFPRCSRAVMDAVYKESIRNPYPNSAMVSFELPVWAPDRGR